MKYLRKFRRVAMRNTYKSLLLALSVVLMIGCHTQETTFNVFDFKSKDEIITTDVGLRFAQNPLLADARIIIKTEQHVVALSGYVKTIRQSDMAAEIASKVDGVKSVQNNIIVRK